MRRWCLITLLFLLPLQFTWAAVAGYCGHDSDAPAWHFGHHDHRHHASGGGMAVGQVTSDPADEVGGDAGASPLQAGDADCGHCHGGCLALPEPAASLAPSAGVDHPATLAEAALRTRTHSPPDRPQWAPLA